MLATMARTRNHRPMLSSFLLLSFYFLCYVPTSSQQQFGNCAGITFEDLGSSNVTSEGLVAENRGEPVAISLLSILCQSAGTIRGKYRSAFVAVETNPETNPQLLELGLICNASNVWIVNPTPPFNEPSLPYTNPTRNNCSFCSPDRPTFNDRLFDLGSYCIACDPDICREGTGLCYGTEDGLLNGCCNYYHNSVCVGFCPSGTTPDSNFDCVTLPPATVPSALILEVGQPLFLDCGSDLYTGITKTTSNNTQQIFPVVNISSVGLDDAGGYLCEPGDPEFAQTLVVVAPANRGNQVVLTDALLRTIPNDSIINPSDNSSTGVAVTCFSPSGHGQLRWTVEGQSTNDDQLRNELAIAAANQSASSSYQFTIGNDTYTAISVVTSNPIIHYLVFGIDILSRDTFVYYLSCRSEESRDQQSVTITNYETFVDSRGTNTMPFLGQFLILTFRVAAEESFTLELTLNGSMLASPTMVTKQVYERNYGPTNTASAGMYTLLVISSQMVVLATHEVTITPQKPTLTSSGNVTVREGERVVLTCTPSLPDIRVEWYQSVDLGDGLTGFSEISEPFGPFNFDTEEFTHSLIIDGISSSERLFRCNIGSSISQRIYVTVLRRCSASLAAGLLWNTSFSGDIVSHRCVDVDPRFSNVVRVSRLCADGIWTPIDFSNCTLNANHDPFILLWLYVNSTAFMDESLIISEITTTVVPGSIMVVPSSASISTLTLADALVGRPSTSASSLGQILYRATLSNATDFGSIGTIMLQFEASFLLGGNFLVLPVESNYGFYTFQASSFCFCIPYFTGFQSAPFTSLVKCVGGVISPCSCMVPPIDGSNRQIPQGEFPEGQSPDGQIINLSGFCSCNEFYVGDNTRCTADSDGDTYPDQPLNCSHLSVNETSLPSYCSKDTCPTIFNIPQTDTSSCINSTDGVECPLETDSTFGFEWGYTPGGTTINQLCGPGFIGNSSRVCHPNGTWGGPNVSGCIGVAFAVARDQIVVLDSSQAADLETVLEIQDTLSTLVEATAPSPNNVSALPLDLQVTSGYLRAVVGYYSRIVDEGLTDITLATISDTESIVDIISNVISTDNLPGAMQLAQDDPQETFAQDILETAEQYGLYLATFLDLLMDAGMGINTTIVAAENILMNPSVVDVNELTEDAVFPPMNVSSLNNVSGAVLNRLEEATINIPSSFILQRSEENNVTRVRISNVIFQNLEMFLSSNIENEMLEPATVVLSSQVQQSRGDPNAVLANPISLSFIALNQNSSQNFTCVFWDFSLRNGLGSWSTTGVTTLNVTDAGNNQTMIQCSSNHLTSFAVLVNVAGVHFDSKALDIVSYIGVGLSLICLLATIVFFLTFGKTLLTSVHNFVHLNLAIALFLAYLTFAVGIELGARNKIACHVVAALLQYLFLAVFCWMLSEGVMLYLMLVVVFSKLSKKWWFFFLLGWLPPILFVIAGLASALDQYGVYDENNALKFCWLAAGGSHFAIWFFAAPMIAIVIINTVFLILVLVSLIRSRGTKREMQDSGKRTDIVVNTIKASLILLPLLGITWVIGLFAVSQNTAVFAWIFLILNTFQGVFFFFFHVLRHERIWGRLKKKYHLFESTSKSAPTSSAAGYQKGNITEKYRSKGNTGSTNVPDSFVSGKYAEEKIPLDEYNQSGVFSADKKSHPSDRGVSEQRLLEGEYKVAQYAESPGEDSEDSPSPNHRREEEKIPLDASLGKQPQSHADGLPEMDDADNHNSLIFDEHDNQYPEISLRLQSMKKPAYSRLNASEIKRVPSMETKEKYVIFSEDPRVKVENPSETS